MAVKALKLVGFGSPAVIVSVLTFVWEWGFRYTVFTLFFVYLVLYFLYWFCTDFWDNI